MLIPEMNDEYILKGAFERIEFGTNKHREFLAAPTVDPTMARVPLNKPAKKNGARHNTRITGVGSVHRRPVFPAYFTV